MAGTKQSHNTDSKHVEIASRFVPRGHNDKKLLFGAESSLPKISINNKIKMVENLLQRYKEIKRKIGHSDEFYKYEAVQHFQDNWKIEAGNFAEMFNEAFKIQTNNINTVQYKVCIALL